VRKWILSLLGVAILAGGATTCVAEGELKPLVTVSFSSYDKLFSNIGMIGELGGNPDLGKAAEAMLTVMTQGKGVPGLDKTRPWGAVLLTDGDQAFTPYGLLPVTDLKQLVELAKGFPQLGEIEETDGVYKLTVNDNSVCLVQKDQWVIIAKDADDFANAPADPAKLLGDLPTKYDLAVKGSIKNIPAPLREYFLTAVQAGAMAGMQQQAAEDNEDYQLGADMAKQAMEQMTSMVNELDELLIGWNIDLTAKTTYLDIEATAQAGTKLAEQFALVKPGKSNFSGFVSPQAAVSANWIGTLSDADVAKFQVMLGELRKRATAELEKQELSDEQAKLAGELIEDGISVLEKTVEAKKTDGGLAVYLNPGEVTVVAGGGIVGGDKLNKLIKQLVDELKKSDPDSAELVKLNAQPVDKVSFHTAAIPASDEEMTRVFGETLDFVLGVGNDKLVGGVGHDAIAKLKDILAQSKTGHDKEVPAAYVTIAVAPIAKFVSEMAEEDDVKTKAAELAELLAGTEGKDHVTVTNQPIPNGARTRVVVEEGLLKLLGKTVSEATSGKAGP